MRSVYGVDGGGGKEVGSTHAKRMPKSVTNLPRSRGRSERPGLSSVKDAFRKGSAQIGYDVLHLMTLGVDVPTEGAFWGGRGVSNLLSCVFLRVMRLFLPIVNCLLFCGAQPSPKMVRKMRDVCCKCGFWVDCYSKFCLL